MIFRSMDECAQVEVDDLSGRLYPPELDDAPFVPGVVCYPALQVPSGVIFPHDGRAGTWSREAMGAQPDPAPGPGCLPSRNPRVVEPDVVSRVRRAPGML